ncbi:hypothetical protein M8J75_003327 [Diaphorina citri]|nr:hypothetical protein M8J75_003327 [Diaphorina citri]
MVGVCLTSSRKSNNRQIGQTYVDLANINTRCLHPSSAATPAPPQSAPPPPVPSSTAAAGPSGFICNRCGRVCRSKAGLVSHSKACLRQPPLERRGNVGPTNA